jgi:hypothetical protein
MKLEIILFLITGFIIANIYTDGKYYKLLLSWKKYYQMIGIAFGAFVLYWLIKKNPSKANQMISVSNEYLKYLPIDQNTSSFLSPILDFTSKQHFYDSPGVLGAASIGAVSTFGSNGGFSEGGGYSSLSNPMSKTVVQENRIMNSGKKATKRSVSETKKKFVASRQNWKCGDCSEQLSAWFEVDHKIRLEYGGSNHIDNLVALCRECHGKKTTIENL